jgi:hypothetical protein
MGECTLIITVAASDPNQCLGYSEGQAIVVPCTCYCHDQWINTGECQGAYGTALQGNCDPGADGAAATALAPLPSAILPASSVALDSPAARALHRAVHAALGLIAGPGDVLARVKDVRHAPDPHARRQAVEALSHAFDGGTPPGDVAAAVVDRVSVLSPYRFQREDPSWQYGTYAFRIGVIRELWAAAEAARNEGEQRRYARAATLLAAQEGFYFGGTMLQWIANRPRFDALAPWSPQHVQRFRDLLTLERAAVRSFIDHLIPLGDAYVDLVNEPARQIPPALLDTYFAEMDQMARVSQSRPERQWTIANYAWRLVNLARDRQRQDVIDDTALALDRLRQQFNDPAFDAWAQAALNTPFRVIETASFKKVNSWPPPPPSPPGGGLAGTPA